MTEHCAICLEKGLQVTATHDAPLPWGPWAYLCGACLYRLPAAQKQQAVELEPALSFAL